MKRGQSAPWKITVQFEDDRPFKRAFPSRDSAMFGARTSLRAAQQRGSRVAVKMWCEPCQGLPFGTDPVLLVLDDNEDVVAA